MEQNAETVELKKELQPKSTIKLTITSKVEDFQSSMDRAYNRLSQEVEVKGFRKGKAPKNMIVEELGPKLYDEALNQLIWELTNKALVQEKLSPISDPEFSLLSFDPTKPIEFSVQFAVYPEVKIGDLSTIKLDKDEVNKAKEAREKSAQTPNEEKTEDSKEAEVKQNEEKKDETPPFNMDKYYSDILDKVFAISEVDVPEALIERELENHIQNFTEKLNELGIQVDDYLKLQNTTLDESKTHWKKDIEFSFKQDFLLAEYAKQQDIKADKDEVEKSLHEVYTPEQIATLDQGMYNYISYALVRQKAFNDLINRIENN